MRQRKKLSKERKNSPTKPENGTASTPTKPETTNQSDTPSETNTQTSVTWSVQNLKYGTFIQLLLGKITPAIVGMTEGDWKAILLEYSSLIETEKSKNLFTAYQRWFYTSWKIYTLEQLLTFLKVAHDADIASEVHNLGYDLVEYKDDREEYLKQIYLIENEAKTLVVLLNQYTAEYKMLTGGDEGAEEVKRDEMHYEKEIAIMSRHMGFRIKKDKITVFEWIGYLNTFLEFNKVNKNGGESI